MEKPLVKTIDFESIWSNIDIKTEKHCNRFDAKSVKVEIQTFRASMRRVFVTLLSI